MSIAKQAARGAAWTIVFGLLARAIGLGGTLVMTHLVAPEVIGEAGAAVILVMFFSWLTTWGFTAYTIVRGRGDDEAEVTWHVWVAHVVLGSIGMATVMAVGRWILPWFGVADAARFVPVAALAVWVRRLTAICEPVLTRRMRFRPVGVSLAVGETTYAVVSVLLASRGYGGMAVVWGNVAQSVAAGSVLAFAAGTSWWKPMRLRAERVRDMLRFGLPLAVEGLAYNTGRYCDKLLMARYFGPGPMAEYNMGYNLADVPAVYVGEQIGGVLMPSLSGLPPERRPAALERATALLALVIFPMCIGLGAVADTLVEAVLSAEWQGVAPFLVLLSAVAILRPISWTLSTYLQVAGRTHLNMTIELTKSVILFGGIAVLARWGLHASAVAVGVAYAVSAAFGVYLVTSGEGPKPTVRGLGLGLLRPLLACLVMVVAVRATRAGLIEVGLAARPRLALELLAGAVSYVIAALVVARPMARDFLAQLRHLRPHSR